MVTKFVTANAYTDAELLALFREGVAAIAATGQSYQIAGRMYTASSLPAMFTVMEQLERRIDAATYGTIATNLVRMVRV